MHPPPLQLYTSTYHSGGRGGAGESPPPPARTAPESDASAAFRYSASIALALCVAGCACQLLSSLAARRAAAARGGAFARVAVDEVDGKA